MTVFILMIRLFGLRRLAASLSSLAVLLVVVSVRAQGVEVTAGASSLIGVNGVTATHYMGDRQTLTSVGVNHGRFVMGGATQLSRADGFTRYGDTTLGFVLPTDMDAAGRSVGARGVQWRHEGKDGSVQWFAGKTGDALGFGYLRSIDPQHWGASVEMSRKVTEAVRVSGLFAAGSAHAALVSGAWREGERAELAATTGWNAGAGIVAASAKLRGETWNVRVSETVGHLQLRPETGPAWLHGFDEMHTPEREGLNFTAEKRFTRWLVGDAERVAYGADAAGGLPQGAQLHEAGLQAREGGWAGGVRVLTSADGGPRTTGFATLASYTHGVWGGDVALLESWRGGEQTGSVVATGSWEFAGRVKLTAGADFVGAMPSMVAGAEVHGGFGSVGVSERMVYVPFGADAGFTKVTQVSVHVHPKNLAEMGFDTLVGKGVPWAYTAVASKFVETSGGGAGQGRFTGQYVEMSRYVVRGKVVDEAGMPVESAAVRVNDATVWTASDGCFEARQKRAGVVRVHVAPAEFVTARRYAAMAGDSEGMALPEAEAKPVVLRVRECRECAEAVATDRPVQAATPSLTAAEVRSGVADLGGWLKKAARVVWRGDLQ